MPDYVFDDFPRTLQRNIDRLGLHAFRMQHLRVRGEPLDWGPTDDARRHRLRVGIIGTRKPSPEGRRFVRELVEGLRGWPVVLVSGGALGIDGEVHARAVEAEIPTEAWLVGPLQKPSPRFHEGLFEAIARRPGSCLVVPSGLEPECSGRDVFAADWLTRNQWLSLGLDVLVVVEAGIRSGTWATVKFALKTQLNIYALPGSIFNPSADGTNLMITNGYAHPIGSVGFLIQAFVEELKRNPYTV